MNGLRSVLDMQMHGHLNRVGKARFGIVSAVDPGAGLVKVRLQPENTETGWICDNAVSVGDAVIYSPAQMGAHVLVETAQGDGDNYVVVTRVFDSVFQPPVFTVANGSTLQPGEIGLKAGGIEFLLSNKGVSILGPVSIKGDVSVLGNVSADGDVQAAGISLVHHVHGTVQPGKGISGVPESV